MDIYTTISGDTWDAIAYKAMGDGYYMDLMLAENPQYADIFLFQAGVQLKVPEVEENTSSTNPPWYE